MQSASLKEMIGTLLERRFRHTRKSDRRSTEDLCQALLSEPGDIATIGIGRQILARYEAMSGPEKAHFFTFLADSLDIDPAAVERLARAYRADGSPALLAALTSAAEPKRQELLRRLNRIPGATSQLVGMRRDLFAAMKASPSLHRIDHDFEHLLSSWFNPGFLVLRRISWNSPATILEKIIAYEAVHAIGDWDDLRRRVEPQDRRCFAYFHPSMPDEPLIFVEVALCHDIPCSIETVLAAERAIVAQEKASSAVFYSISNCQQGLRGVSFGNSLIKQVVEELSQEFPYLATFVTLSPIPGFREWVESERDAVLGNSSMPELAAHYLLETKRDDGLPRDSVARFHLANGATVHDIHEKADRSANGLHLSYGLMVNYLYDLKRLDANIEAYFAKGRVPRSPKVADLMN